MALKPLWKNTLAFFIFHFSFFILGKGHQENQQFRQKFRGAKLLPEHQFANLALKPLWKNTLAFFIFHFRKGPSRKSTESIR
jgi:hypothetical protein